MPILEINGRRVEVDDSFTSMTPEQQSATVDEIARSMGGGQQPAPTATPAQVQTPAETPQPVNQGLDAPTYVMQQANRGIADVAGAPVDLLSAGLNLGLIGVDTLAEMFGGNVDTRIENPVMGSDWIADKASGAYEAVGGNVVPPEAVSPTTQALGLGARGTTAALLPGMGLASGPVQAATQAGRGGRAMQALAKPYASSPGATLARDAAAGGGAGLAAGSYDDSVVDRYVPESLDPLAMSLMSLMGGVGGAGVANIAEGAVKGGSNFLRNLFMGSGDPNAPVNPATGKPFTRTEMDQAAYVAQEMPTNRGQAVANIDEGAREFSQFATPGQTPTVGMLADDIGMAQQENVMRARDPRRFVERDAARRSAASSRIEESAPKGAEGRNFTQAAQQQMDEVTARQTAAADDIARQNVELETARARQPEASANLDRQFRTDLEAQRGRKNELYGAVDDATPVDSAAIKEQLAEVDASVPQAARTSGEYAAVANRLGNLDDLTYGDVKVLRADINAMRKEAVAAGKDVTYLDRVGRVLSGVIDETNPEAAQFYREEFAPRFKTGRAGEHEASLKRAARTGEESSATRPSEFGQKFLRKPEDAASLKRAVPDLDENNVNEWMMGDLAQSGVLTKNAQIRFDKFKQWADRNKDVIDQFPAVRKRVDSELTRAQQGGRISQQLADEVAAAKRTLGPVLDKSPANAVASVMGSGDPEKRMAELVDRMKGDQAATDGVKAAVRDWIKDKAGVTSKIVGDPDATRLSRANLEDLFAKHEKTLAKVYTPDEMNALRQAHKLMNAEAKLDVRATAGSNTLDKVLADQKASLSQKKRVLEGALKAKFGVLKGGGIFRTMNIFLESLPDGNRGLEDILFEMNFNPDLAKHLLTRSVKDIGSPTWNSKLNTLLAAATGARESVEGDDGPLELTVTKKDTQN